MTETELIRMRFKRILKKLKSINSDKTKQSYGNLDPLEDFVIQALESENYSEPGWYFKTPRWLGEFGNTKDEEEVNSLIIELMMIIANVFHGGWGSDFESFSLESYKMISEINESIKHNCELDNFLLNTNFIPSNFHIRLKDANIDGSATSINWLNEKLNLIKERTNHCKQILDIESDFYITSLNYNYWVKKNFTNVYNEFIG